MSFTKSLVKAFCEAAKDLHNDYVETWLSQKDNDEFKKITDFDMDMILLDEKKRRIHTYKKLENL